MNIQPGRKQNVRPAGSAVKPSRQGTGSLNIGGKLCIVLKAAVLISAIAGILNCYIYLQQKITETDRQIASANKELGRVVREIALWRLQCETDRSWSHIQPMLAKYHIRMVIPRSGQVTSLKVLTPQQAAVLPLPVRARVLPTRTAQNGNSRFVHYEARRN